MINIEVNSKSIEKQLTALALATQNRSSVMRKIAGTMHYAVQENFNEGGRPKWLGIKHRKGSPLVDTEFLQDSIEEYYTNDSAMVGTNVIYAAIHQFGGMAGRNRKVKIHARPFLQLTEDDKDEIVEIMQKYLQNVID